MSIRDDADTYVLFLHIDSRRMDTEEEQGWWFLCAGGRGADGVELSVKREERRESLRVSYRYHTVTIRGTQHSITHYSYMLVGQTSSMTKSPSIEREALDNLSCNINVLRTTRWYTYAVSVLEVCWCSYW
jgi:hypothetical protein